MPQPDAPSDPIRSEFADDPDMAELIEMFLDEMPARVDALGECLREERLTELQTIAHQLKGAGAGYGFEPVSISAASLEGSLKAHSDLERIRADVDDLISICRRLSR
ncbi:MAG: Hpt domain-containing protein [Planctomycetota bacterium]|nr:MAG: Hpt domain-containing protein [Planctomycetota bacterium]